MWDTGPWVRGMGTWHHLFFTCPPIYFSKYGPGPVHGTAPLKIGSGFEKMRVAIWHIQTLPNWIPSVFE